MLYTLPEELLEFCTESLSDLVDEEGQLVKDQFPTESR